MFIWDEESEKTLKNMWADGVSASKIAKHLGTTKGSIVGKVRRMKLEGRQSPIGQKVKTPAPKAAPKETLQPVIPKPVQKIERRVKVSVSTPSNVLIKTCQFPIGDPKKPGFRFCEKPAKLGKPYCMDCCKVAYITILKAA